MAEIFTGQRKVRVAGAARLFDTKSRGQQASVRVKYEVTNEITVPGASAAGLKDGDQYLYEFEQREGREGKYEVCVGFTKLGA
jgi:hypothetical protein